MGNGLITRAWVALVYGVLLTGAAEVVLWVMPYFSENLPLAMFGSLMRLPIAAAFALRTRISGGDAVPGDETGQQPARGFGCRGSRAGAVDRPALLSGSMIA